MSIEISLARRKLASMQKTYDKFNSFRCTNVELYCCDKVVNTIPLKNLIEYMSIAKDQQAQYLAGLEDMELR